MRGVTTVRTKAVDCEDKHMVMKEGTGRLGVDDGGGGQARIMSSCAQKCGQVICMYCRYLEMVEQATAGAGSAAKLSSVALGHMPRGRNCVLLSAWRHARFVRPARGGRRDSLMPQLSYTTTAQPAALRNCLPSRAVDQHGAVYARSTKRRSNRSQPISVVARNTNKRNLNALYNA